MPEQQNQDFVRDVQRWLNREGYTIQVDGIAGVATREAFFRRTGTAPPPAAPRPETSPNRWPGPTQRELIAFYGQPGTGQTQIDLPFPMRLAWDTDTVVEKITCHERVAASLFVALRSILRIYGSLSALREDGLDLLGGCYNLRKMRDRDEWSLHAFGAAIDLDPIRNGLSTPWPKRATMPEPVIRMFEAEGWTSLGRVIGRDAMHFQATSWSA